jgi:hypothetical protein
MIEWEHTYAFGLADKFSKSLNPFWGKKPCHIHVLII